MTVLDVYVNDRQRCRAGVGADGVLSAIVNWVKLTGPAARTARRRKQPLEESRLHVGGLRGATHRSWIDQYLRIGDRVTIAVGRARSADPPAREKPRSTPDPRTTEETAFLNVDLDVVSKSPLGSLVSALGRSIVTLYVGPEGRRHVAHLETGGNSRDPNRLVRRFVELIRKLPRAEKRVWDRATQREFNIGIQAGVQPHGYELHLDPETVHAAASVGAGIGVTVYAASPPPRPKA